MKASLKVALLLTGTPSSPRLPKYAPATNKSPVEVVANALMTWSPCALPYTFPHCGTSVFDSLTTRALNCWEVPGVPKITQRNSVAEVDRCIGSARQEYVASAIDCHADAALATDAPCLGKNAGAVGSTELGHE